MKKIKSLLLLSCLLFATGFSVSAKQTNNHENHYDFYGKAGPVIEKNIIEEKILILDVESNFVFKNHEIILGRHPGSNDLVFAKKTSAISSHYGEFATADYNIRRPQIITMSEYPPGIERPLNKRRQEVNQPPLNFGITMSEYPPGIERRLNKRRQEVNQPPVNFKIDPNSKVRDKIRVPLE